MKGSAPKSPETGSHAWRVKNFHPNWTRLRCERTTRIVRMKRTIAKMLHAQRSITRGETVVGQPAASALAQIGADGRARPSRGVRGSRPNELSRLR